MREITFKDLEHYHGFKELDKKVNFINKNRSVCEYLIRELNHKIDLDYVKQSEMIEDEVDSEFNKFVMDENTKVLRSEPKLPINELLNAKSEEEYHEILDRQEEESTIVLVRNKEDGTSEVTQCANSGHLIALNYALRQARKDRRLIQLGKKVEMESDFIEYVNEKILSKVLVGGPTAGYGRYRSRVYRYGEFSEINVRVSGAKFSTTPGTMVYDEMNELVKEYNESKLHPILKAIVFKTKFIRIHPFSDFNGRTSRILLNYMLVRYGYPTVTIKGSQRKRYIDAMEKAIVEDDYSALIEIVKTLLNKRCDKYISIIEETANEKGISLN